MSHIRSLLFTLLAIGAIIVAFVYFVDLRLVADQLRAARPLDVALASALFLGGLVAYAWRWWSLLAGKPGRRYTFHAANIGHLLNIFIPLRLGEPARIVVMGRSGAVTVAEATASFVLERLFEQVMRLSALLAAIGLGAGAAIGDSALIGGGLFVIGAALFIGWMVRSRSTVLARWPAALARLPRVTEAGARRALTDWLDNLTAVANPRRLLAVAGWSLLAWGCFWGYHYFTLTALRLPLSPADLRVVAFVALAVAPPSAPTQPGIYHLSVAGPLVLVGFAREPMTAYAVLLHALQIIWLTPLAIWGLSQTGFTLRGLVTASQARAN